MLLLKPVLPVFSYIMNYDYIVAELCENKAKPEMHCNGKCHLMKELAKASETEKPLSQKKAAAEAEILFFMETAIFAFAENHTFVLSENFKGYQNLYSFLSLSATFHPPASVC